MVLLWKLSHSLSGRQTGGIFGFVPIEENRARFCLNNENTLYFAAVIRHLEVQ